MGRHIFTSVGIGRVGQHEFMGWVFFCVGWEDFVGSPGVEAFIARTGASVSVRWKVGAVWIHGLGVFFLRQLYGWT